MSGAGLIYAAIAIMWAAVLIPMWLRNHESASESRSAERFGQAMRVLSRKEQSAADDEADTRRVERAETRPVERPAAPMPAREARAPRRASRQRHQRTLVQRRARTLAVMTGLTLLLGLVAAVTPLPWWTPIPVATLLVAFVVHLRIQALQTQNRRLGQARRSAEPVAVPAPEPPFERSASGFVSGPSRAVVVETKGAHTAEVTFDAAQTWRPNELPLPTYVTAPKAIRPIKVIDLTTPGAWSSGRLLDDGVSEEDLLAAEVADAELDALLEQEVSPPAKSDEHDDSARRAVGD